MKQGLKVTLVVVGSAVLAYATTGVIVGTYAGVWAANLLGRLIK